MIDILNQLDISLFLKLNSLHNSFFDVVMYYLSQSIIIVGVFLWLLYYFIPQYRYKTFLILLFVSICILLTDQISVHLFKDVFQRLRPCHNPQIEGLVHLVNGKCGGQFGFVSSHAANTFGIAVFSSLLLKRKKLSIALILIASLISYSRIYLGVHFPGDVFCGALLGAFIGWLVYRLFLLVLQRL